MARKPKISVSLPMPPPPQSPEAEPEADHSPANLQKILELGEEVDQATDVLASARAKLRRKQHALNDFIRNCRKDKEKSYPLFDGKSQEGEG
jgi:hypothetical protein